MMMIVMMMIVMMIKKKMNNFHLKVYLDSKLNVVKYNFELDAR